MLKTLQTINENNLKTEAMYYLSIIILVITSLSACNNQEMKEEITYANNVVVAHRGAWKTKNLPENSIASLRHAIALGCTGSEFDVRMTADSILVVNHDSDYFGLAIEDNNYKTLNKNKLSNGEDLPTLKAYIQAGMENNTSTGLVCELKPASSKESGAAIAAKTLNLVKELNAEDYISSYISFDYNILLSLLNINPKLHTQYLTGEKSPAELKADGIAGLDYHFSVFNENPAWVTEARELGLTLNAWTVNNKKDLINLLNQEFDFITTNEPELLFELANNHLTNKSYELVWSDEFNYNGKPNPKKWTYDYGFIANQEEQYYTDSLKNARVKDGSLIIEAHKEKIANDDFKNNELLNTWQEYKTKIDTAQYTSARLKTEGLAGWKYGYIEVRAKLPKGRGMWSAIWMLSENIKEIGWPESGEIDIMEHVGYDNDTIHGTIHTKAYNHIIGTQKGKSVFIENPNDEFHVFAIEWTPEKIDFMLDGVVYNHIENEHKTTAEWPFDHKFYLILNVAVGGSWGGQKGIDNSIFPQRMIVDYVRVYQKPE